MRRFEGIRRVFRLGLAGGDSDRDVDRELAFHFEAAVEALMARGMSESEARAEARRRFGDEAEYRRELRRLARDRDRRWRAWESLRGVGWALRDAVRGIRRAPALAVAMVAVMSLGVGANATMFGILDRIFLRPPAHVEDPDEVRRVFVHRRDFNGRMFISSHHTYPDYLDWRGVEAFEETAAYSARELTVGHGAAAESRNVTFATGSFFPLLGARPALGRFFTPEEDRLGGERVAVLGHGYWRGQYGGEPSAVGSTIDVGEATYTVIGVAPEGFTGVGLGPVDIFLPFQVAGEVQNGLGWVDSRGWYWFEVVARLAEGANPELATAAATTVHRAARADDENYDAEARVELASLILARTGQAADEARVVPWLMGVAVLVLLLTCANVGNLLLARAIQRRRETAVRLALGTSRGRLIGSVVAESMVLALLGGVAAVAIAVWGGDLVRSFLLPEIAWSGATTARVMLFSAAVAIGAGLLAGVFPALRSGRSDVAETLKSQSRGSSRGRSRMQSGLLVFQAAVSVVLLVGTSLFVLSLDRARAVDLGYDPASALYVGIEPEGEYPEAEGMVRLYQEARERVAALPGVEAAAITTSAPFRSSRSIDGVRTPGMDSLPRTGAGSAYINTVTGGYFEAMGLRILRGRGLTDADDTESAPHVAVVNETFAELVWPDEDPLGQCLLVQEAPCATIVGVVENSRRYGLVEDPSMKYYLPLAKSPYAWPPNRLVIRTADPEALAPTVRRSIVDAVPGVRLVSTQPFAEVVGPRYRSWELGAALFGAFGLLALLVAALGLYSVLAFDIAQRRRELGIRSALGAGRRRIVSGVLGDGLRLAGIGVAVGLAAAAVAAPRIEPLLFQIEPRDPLVLAMVAVTLLVVAALASGVPAWRATRVDPREALEAD